MAILSPQDLIKNGQRMVKGDHLQGMYRGIVEANDDPYGLGRVKARVYALHGGTSGIPLEDLAWCDPVFAMQGTFYSPPIGEKVWVLFEAADRDHPLWFGTWYSVSDGKGSDAPRETWDSGGGGASQKMSVARSKQGNQIMFEDQGVGGYYSGGVTIADAGGKTMSVSSYMPGGSYDSENPKGTSPRKSERLTDYGICSPGTTSTKSGNHSTDVKTAGSGQTSTSAATKSKDGDKVSRNSGLGGTNQSSTQSEGGKPTSRNSTVGKVSTSRAEYVTTPSEKLDTKRAW